MLIVLYILLGIIGIILLLLLVAVVKTLLTPTKTSVLKEDTNEERARGYAEKLSKMVACETVSGIGQTDISRYLEFHKVLESLYPAVFEKMEKIEIDGNLLFKWKGKGGSRPIVLMSHQDVVPATPEGWKHPPFSGDIADGKVWGRGSGDTKCSLMGFFQACEELLEEGYVPESDVYLSSSCTEEWGGDGCPKLVAKMKEMGVTPFMVCDEGGAITTNPIPGVKGSFAMIGVYEKGQGDLLFKAKGNGGHASSPSKNTPIARLAAFVNDVEKHSPFKKKMGPEVQTMFETLAPYASFGLRLVFENLWLFKPLLVSIMPKISPQGAAMLQTTCAFTMASGSKAINVIPDEATVGANLRFIPHQGMDESIAIMKEKAASYDIETEVVSAREYTKPSDIHGEAFRLLEDTIASTFPGLAMSPYVMTGGTDARDYQEICDNVFRFAPVVYGPEQLKGMHALNENIEYSCLPGCVDFYKNLIKAI
ncbi:MAG: M20/M25/M40 family metallo-hydrolase [Oscillospiraceae bacterium]|jgi:carboxypeptidase PM20D1